MANKEYWKQWAKATGVRTIKTMAEVAGSFVVVGMAVNEIDWLHMLSVTVVSGVATILLAIKGLPEVGENK